MATYILLGRFTDQGIKTVKDIPNRRAATRATAESLGITFGAGYLTMGQYEVAFVLESPNSEAIAKFALTLGIRGNLSTQTLRAFSNDEVDALLSDL
jgi:uncharacterized protein with GYD domain